MRRSCGTVLGSLCVVAGTIACAPAAKAPESAAAVVDTTAVVAAVSDLWAKWAVADTAEDLDAIVALMDSTARFDARGFPPMRTSAEMKAALTQAYQQIDYLEASTSPAITTAVSNDLALQAGSFMERYINKGKPKPEMTDYGRYAGSYARMPDGQWRVTYMMSFVDSTVTKK